MKSTIQLRGRPINRQDRFGERILRSGWLGCQFHNWKSFLMFTFYKLVLIRVCIKTLFWSIALGRITLRIHSHYSRTLRYKWIKCETNNFVLINMGGGKVTFFNRWKEPAFLESIECFQGFSFRGEWCFEKNPNASNWKGSIISLWHGVQILLGWFCQGDLWALQRGCLGSLWPKWEAGRISWDWKGI